MEPQPPLRTTHTTRSPKNILMYDRWGSFGRPVLLLHGLLFDRTMWWPAAAELAGECTIVAPDLPGHGATPARDDCSLRRLARDLAGLVEDLDLHRAPIVVGHAASAALAEEFADSYATHHVLTLDDEGDLDDVPEFYRPYAQTSHDASVLNPYGSWVALTPAGRATAGPPEPSAPFPHLADPVAFAARLRAML
jgi:pimeloyl-ACP methyl ester carboxylesterase